MVAHVSRCCLPGFVVDSWYGILAPAGTPQAIVMKAQHGNRPSLAFRGAENEDGG